MVLSSRDRVKSSKQKSSTEKLKDKRIHDNLILLRVTFSINRSREPEENS